MFAINPAGLRWFTAAFFMAIVISDVSAFTTSVMTFNFWVYRGSTSAQMNVIRDADPDLIGTQEALYDKVQAITSLGKNYQSVGQGRDGGNAGEFNAIFFKKDKFRLIEGNTLWQRDGDVSQPGTTWGNAYIRIFTYARLQHFASGQEFYFYNTHLDNVSVYARQRGSEQIAAHIRANAAARGLPFLLTGDMNTGWKSGETQSFWGGDFLRWLHIIGIDWITGSAGISAVSTGSTSGGDVSDHPILWATVDINGGDRGSGGGENYQVKQNLDIHGPNLVEHHNKQVADCPSLCNANSACTCFVWGPWNGGTCYLKASAESTGYHSQTTSGSLYGFTSNVDMRGVDLEYHNYKQTSECAGLCKRHGQCTGFTWTSWRSGTCFLKKDINTNENYGLSGAVSAANSINFS